MEQGDADVPVTPPHGLQAGSCDRAEVRWLWLVGSAGDPTDPLDSAGHTMGVPITAGSKSSRPAGTTSGSIPVAVAPPGSSRLTVTPVSRRSAAMIRDSASLPARDGP